MSFVKNNRDELFDAVKEVAAEEDVEVYRVLGFMQSHCTKSNYADLWKSIWKDKRNKSKPTSVMETHVPILTAMTIYSDCGPGQQSTNQRKLFSLAGYDILSLWYKLKEEQKKTFTSVKSPHSTCWCLLSILACCKNTIQQIT